MNINLIKNLPVAIACLSSAAIFAGMDMDSRVSQLEAQMKQVRTATSNDSFGAKTAEDGPMMGDAVGVFIGIGAVYQTAILGGTEYAYSDDGSADSVEAPINGSLREDGGNWAWGVNAQIGYNTGYDGWDIRLANSFYNTSHSSSTTAGTFSTVVPVGIISNLGGADAGYVDYAKSNLEITYDLLGLELGRGFYLSQYLSIRPNTGLLTSWIWTTQKTAYSGGELDQNSFYVKNQSNWFGIGPELGLDTSWTLGRGFSIFANGKGSLLYGRFKFRHTEEDSAVTTAKYEIDLNNSNHRIVPYMQALLGLQYEYTMDDADHSFLIRAGWNTQFFFSENQNLTPNYVETGAGLPVGFTKKNQNLQVQGLIIDANWLF